MSVRQNKRKIEFQTKLVDPEVLDRFSEQVIRTRNKAKMSVSGRKISEFYARELSVIAQAKTAEFTVCLSNCNVGVYAFRILLEGLQGNLFLKELVLEDLRINRLGWKDFAEEIVSLKRLESVAIRGCELNDLDMQCVAELFRENCAIQRIDFSRNQLTEVGVGYLVERIRGNACICELDLSDNRLGNAGVVKLASLFGEISSNRIQKLNLSLVGLHNEGLLKLLCSLQGDAHLEDINLEYNEINSDLVKLDFSELRKPKNALKIISLSENDLGSFGLKQIISIINFSALEEFRIFNCRIDDSSLSYLFKSLRKQHHMKRLNLGGNFLGNGAFKELSILLSTNTSIQTLDLSKTGVDSDSLSELLKSIQSNKFISELCLNESNFKDSDLADFIKYLSKSRSLSSLSLENCKIGDIGAQTIALLLKQNRDIISLNLKNNLIGDAGAHDLERLIRETDSLKRLLMSGNRITDQFSSKFIHALRNNRSIVEFDLIAVFNDEQIKLLDAYIFRNKIWVRVATRMLFLRYLNLSCYLHSSICRISKDFIFAMADI
jgi:Ran GTPase-activating protein (RanGAP) involved in mRNA processing and transport